MKEHLELSVAEPPDLEPVNLALLFAYNRMESGIMMLPARN